MQRNDVGAASNNLPSLHVETAIFTALRTVKRTTLLASPPPTCPVSKGFEKVQGPSEENLTASSSSIGYNLDRYLEFGERLGIGINCLRLFQQPVLNAIIRKRKKKVTEEV